MRSQPSWPARRWYAGASTSARSRPRTATAGGSGAARDPAGRAPDGLDGPARPLEECLDGFWSPGLSPARLRALVTVPDAAAPDLLLRSFEPPAIAVRGRDLADLLGPAYRHLAGVPGGGSQAAGGNPVAVR